MNWLNIVLHVLGVLLVVITVLPLWHTSRWWVRLWDFPRFQVAVLSIAVLFAFALTQSLTPAGWGLVGALAASLAWQVSWVWRYLPGAPRKVMQSKAESGTARGLTLVTTNVLQSNRDVARLLRIILDGDPDVVLAVETDEWWCSELVGALRARYPHTISYPLSTGYGLTLLSRLELIDPEVRFVRDEAVPSIRTSVRLRDGSVLDLYGVHPRPPSVLQDSTERDQELLLVAREIKLRDRPAILLGDLNDVAWSPSTNRFAHEGRLLDPRRGRGFYNTYPAALPGLRYPLDYIFATSHFDICRMKVLKRFGSDHLPLLAEFHLRVSKPNA